MFVALLAATATVAKPVFGDIPEVIVSEGWWVGLLPIVIQVLSALLLAGVTWLTGKILKKTGNDAATKVALDALAEGMSKAQDEIVRDAKKAAADGKLSKAEIEAAKSMAWDHAKSVVTGPAKKIVVNWGAEKVGSLIKQLLSKWSSKKKQV